MRCPHCRSRVLWPNAVERGLRNGLFNEVAVRCPSCAEKVTYAFSGKVVAALFIPAAAACWVASTFIGDAVFLLFPLLVIVPAMRLEKWY